MVAPWRDLARNVDAHVDAVWGEPVRLIPWIATELSDGMVDDTRTVVDAVGVYEDATAGPVSGGGNNAAFQSREVAADVILSIRREPLELAQLKKDDRVEFTDRAETCEVAFIGPMASDRYKVQLLRINEADE